jgi:hypothetical protein
MHLNIIYLLPLVATVAVGQTEGGMITVTYYSEKNCQGPPLVNVNPFINQEGYGFEFSGVQSAQMTGCSEGECVCQGNLLPNCGGGAIDLEGGQMRQVFRTLCDFGSPLLTTPTNTLFWMYPLHTSQQCRVLRLVNYFDHRQFDF